MFRLSDLMGNKEKPIQPAEGPAAPTPPPPPQPPAPPDPVKPRSVTRPEAPRPLTGLEPVYAQLVACVKTLFEHARTGKPLDVSAAWRLMKQLAPIETQQCQELLSLLERQSQDNYLYTHSVNVALLASHLGHCLGYPREAIHELALAGLLQDLGMAGEAEQLASLPRKLTGDEWKVIARHPATALEHLKMTRGVSPEVLATISAHHERPDGSGYPTGLRNTAIAEYSKILAVCDVYDALTHPRSHRKRFTPAQAIKVLVDGANSQFDRRVVKALVDELSLYPRGSLVRLSTNEVGIVEQVHPEAPLRPVVLVSRDANQTPLLTPRRVDLLEQPFIYVKEVVTEEDA